MDELQAQVRFRTKGGTWISSEIIDASEESDFTDQLINLRDLAIEELEGCEE